MLEEVKNNIIVYSGTYVKDRRYGQRNDYLTYDDNPKGEYKLYLDLENGNPYNIELDKCIDFEKENITIYIPVVAYSTHEYMKNFLNLQKWFLEQQKTYTREEIKEQLIEKTKHKYQNLFNACNRYPEKQLVRKFK